MPDLTTGSFPQFAALSRPGYKAPSPEVAARMNTSVTTTGAPLQGGLLLDKSRPKDVGRLLSSAQHAINSTHANGGYSADLWSMDEIPYGSKSYMVGGEYDSRTLRTPQGKNNRKPEHVPTQLVDVGSPDPRMTLSDVIGTREKLMAAAQGYKQPVFGTWNATDDDGKPLGRVDVDLSTRFDKLETAKDFTLRRNEYALWDNEKGETVTNEQIRRERGKPVSESDTVKKNPKQEVIHRRHGEV